MRSARILRGALSAAFLLLAAPAMAQGYRLELAPGAQEETVVSWARFGELFSYDDDAALFSLENPT